MSTVLLAGEMYVAGLISSGVQQSPSFDKIITDFTTVLKIMSFSKINQHCAKLLLILTKLRGAYAVVSDCSLYQVTM